MALAGESLCETIIQAVVSPSETAYQRCGNYERVLTLQVPVQEPSRVFPMHEDVYKRARNV